MLQKKGHVTCLEHCGNTAVCHEQPLHSEISSAPTLLGLQGSGSGEPLMESMGDPVEELREAVEMLNDTVRERGRAQSHEHAVQELLKKVRRPSASNAKLTLKPQLLLKA